MRTLITAIVVTGWMLVTGCSSLKQPDAHVKQSNACFDKGRSGYWCPNTAKAVASDASTKIDEKVSN